MDELTNTKGVAQHLTVVGEFLLDRETIRVWRGNKPLRVSMRQFQMLDHFMRHAGEPVSHKALKDLVWGPDATIKEANVTAEIVRLRRAIGGRRREQPIRTLRKLGYVFESPKRRKTTRPRLQPESAQ
jgi:two-component system phosphate regulon response regulator PhoB